VAAGTKLGYWHRAPRGWQNISRESGRAGRRRILAGALVGAVALPILLGATGADAAAFVIHPDRAGEPGPAPMPVAAVALPAGLEEAAPYQPQVSCDPHIKPGVKAFEDLVLRTWQRGHSGGSARGCDTGGVSEHREGRAWDWMLDPHSYADVTAGQRVIDWLLTDGAANARRLGLMYFIWDARIWSAHRIGDGWQPYSGENDHTSHIHFSFDWAGAEKRTSWWTGKVAAMEYGPCRKYIGDPAPPYGETINLEPCADPIPKPVPSAVENPTPGPTAVPTPTPAPTPTASAPSPSATPGAASIGTPTTSSPALPTQAPSNPGAPSNGPTRFGTAAPTNSASPIPDNHPN
jgi:hypothetical protein